MTEYLTKKEIIKYVDTCLGEGKIQEAVDGSKELLRKYEEHGNWEEAYKLSNAIYSMQIMDGTEGTFAKTIDILLEREGRDGGNKGQNF